MMLMVGARGFEPPTSRSRTVRSTRLSHAPTMLWIIPKPRAKSYGNDQSLFALAPRLLTLCSLHFGLSVSQVAPHPPNNCQHNYNSDDEVESMKECLEPRILVPTLT